MSRTKTCSHGWERQEYRCVDCEDFRDAELVKAEAARKLSVTMLEMRLAEMTEAYGTEANIAVKRREERDAALEVLRAIEWRGFHRNFPEPVCPYCGGERDNGGHKERCTLAEVLR